MKNITLEMQMELTLAAVKNSKAPKPAPRRAGWWFGQMRQLVDKAVDRKPRPAPPRHQVYMALQGNEPRW